MAVNTTKIALDGPSGSGKSTLAKRIAKEYGFIYIDTGALYRAIGLYVCRNGVASDDTASIIAMLPSIDVTMHLVDGAGRVFLSGKALGDEIRTPQISAYASDVSKIPEVRAFLLELQRGIARQNNVVMDGRDIGTVILPDANVKIFLTASDETRANRRFLELKAKGQDVTLEQIFEGMRRRDTNDSTRAVAPAVPAEDAIFLDNSVLDAEQTFAAAKQIIDEAL